jgi:hypothetical protein
MEFMGDHSFHHINLTGTFSHPDGIIIHKTVVLIAGTLNKTEDIMETACAHFQKMVARARQNEYDRT